MEPEHSPAPPSVLQVVRSITALEARRWLNRRPWKRPKKGEPRSGTARKGAPAKLLLAFISLIFVFNVTSQVQKLMFGVAAKAELRDHPNEALLLPESLLQIEAVLPHLSGEKPPSPADLEQLSWAFARATAEESMSDRRLFQTQASRLEALYLEHGRAALRPRQVRQTFWPSSSLWYHSADALVMLAPIGVFGLLLAMASLFTGVVGPDRDLARADSSLEWWFTFPVSARGLLLARVLGSALINPLPWVLLLPFFSLVFGCAGLGPYLGLLLGLYATLYFGLLLGSVRVVLETTLRSLLPLRQVAIVQATLEVVAAVPGLLAVACTTTPGLSYLSEHARGLPRWALYNPLTLPLCFLLDGPSALAAALASVGLIVATVYGAVSLGSFMLRDGLTTTSGPLLGSRRRVASAAGPSLSLLSVIARRELTSIARDPGRLARVLVFPFLSIGFSALAEPSFLHAIITSPDHASAAAFGVGASVLMGGGLLSLANEGPGLWLFYTAPHTLDSVLVRKAVVWSTIALAVSALSLAALALIAHSPTFVWSGKALLALIGIALYGSISVALGALGTDVLESERARRMQPFTAQLFLLLTGMFFFALYSPSLWAKFAQLSLSSLFAFALWQKVKDHTPYFLDPTEAPPPRIAVADGIFAALAFFVLQGLLGLLFTKLHISPGLSILFAFVGAGLLVTAGSLFIFFRMGVPRLMIAVGLSADGGRPLRAALEGVLLGGLSGAVAVAYTRAVQSVDWLRAIYDETERMDPTPAQLPWLCALAVLAAPLFEELIFRGILYRGFRRSLPPLYAALASSLVFALVHPPLAFVPVFVMAVCAASVFERSRLLLAPMLTHMTYNAIIVGLSLWSS
ncbi:MAG: hypothetical protein JWN04_5659 [Myxococcaceae bacterium]|nr:hypothetical protein [Myxococcaceae bacterium]